MRAFLVGLGVWLAASVAAAEVRCEDAALSEAAVELVLADGEPSRDALLASARRAGSDAPTVHALVIVDGDDSRVARWIASLRERLRAPIACGEARSDDRVVVVAAPRAGTLHIEDDRVRVELAPGFVEPVLFVEDAHGNVERVEPVDGAATLALAELELPLRVQLVARGDDGPRPVAERDVGTDVRALPADSVLPDVRVDAVRRQAGVSPLRPHRLLASIAQDHAANVCRVARAAHELAPGRDPQARARARGIEARHLGEVVARGADVDEAFRALARSPSHRAALVDRRFTDAGVGIANDDAGRACVVVLLAAWPRLVVGSR